MPSASGAAWGPPPLLRCLGSATPVLGRMRAPLLRCLGGCREKHVHTRTHAHTRTHVHRTRTHTHTHTRIHTHTRAYTYTRAPHTHTHAHTHAHTHTHARTHTHTHTLAILPFRLLEVKLVVVDRHFLFYHPSRFRAMLSDHRSHERSFEALDPENQNNQINLQLGSRRLNIFRHHKQVTTS